MARPKKISMQNIADRLGLSKNAVSLALSGKKGVSETVRRSVLAAAEELGYEPPAAAGRADRASRNVLVLVPERVVSYADNEHFHFFHDMLWILEESIRARGCNAVIARIDAQMESGLILPRLYDDVDHIGLILFGIVDKPYARQVWETGAPLVMLDSYYRDLPCAAAVSANTEGAEAVVRRLIERGHRRIGFIGPANLTTSHEERWFGYWRAMREAGLPIEESHTLLEAGDFDEETNEREIGEFLERMGTWPDVREAEEADGADGASLSAESGGAEGSGGSGEVSGSERSRVSSGAERRPTAFFCGNDRLALLLIRRLRARGIAVPQEVEVAGFDGLQQAASPESGLSVTVRVDKRKMCKAAVDLLLGGYGHRREAVRWTVDGQLLPVDEAEIHS
ncbi:MULTISPECIES: substrate-binding domain-containing protein [Saccharibacillus]|uniref:substrate-binding domain-containing protein n=1 Tax=Saccharibacillus TaxID=456492 RepID=UPI0012390372|nr:substrate-binding domain-containing protein [Saccharibacillus sp. WB 17]MWJ31190.1 LacI family DNA-binding transcriptional regulator [Saccharibacillus sp. WB 17]